MSERRESNEYLENSSPFETGLGRFCNMVRIPLGEGKGWFELHEDGRLDLFSVDCPEDPVFQFNAEHGEAFEVLGRELTSLMPAWEQWKLEHADDENLRPADEGLEDERKPAQIVKGGSDELNQFALR